MRSHERERENKTMREREREIWEERDKDQGGFFSSILYTCRKFL